jgi:hypothetical protein
MYRAWTTVSDGWLTDWGTREEMVKYLQSRVMRDARARCKQIADTFPVGWWTKDLKRIDEAP